MATGKRYEIPPVPVKPEVRIELTLSEPEARYLYKLLGYVGGCGRMRQLNDAITQALYDAGVRSVMGELSKTYISLNDELPGIFS